MSEIEAILSRGPSYRQDEPRSQPGDIAAVETELGIAFPPEYREFVEVGGLQELAFDQQILAPREILESLRYVPDTLIPFASNGCGDLYCWYRSELPSSQVAYFDHETSSTSPTAESFVEALNTWRR